MKDFRFCLPTLLIAVVLACGSASLVWAQDVIEEPTALVDARMVLEASTVAEDSPVWALFTLTNLTNDPLSLQVPQAPQDDRALAAMGLPLAHVFSGAGFSAATVKSLDGQEQMRELRIAPAGAVPVVKLAPNGSVGLRVDLTQYYEGLAKPGEYELTWQPYESALSAPPVILTVLPRQEAVIKTDFGSIRLKLLYDKAPVHVRNFVELISDEFYDGLTFHRVVPGGLIQGGAPKEDIMGVRPDGKRLRAEFNDVEFVAGTVGMARLADDPHSASCQFFVCLSRQPWLDRKQTAFAQVIGKESFDTLDDIAAVATDDRDKPLEKVYIRSISLENVKEEVEANDDEKSDARKVPIQRLGPEQSGGKMHSSVALRSQPAVGSVSDAVTTRPAGGQ